MASGGVSEDGDAGFQIAPMVDVVFVLLLFFMASAGSQIVEKELSVNLPSRPSGIPSDIPIKPPIIIDILANGQVQANTRTFDDTNSKALPELRLWLKDTITKFGAEDTYIVRPAPNTRHERIIDVLDAAAASGVKSLTFS